MLRDRRKFYRWAAGLDCFFNCEDRTLAGQVVNLSFGGARVVCAGAAPVEGTDIDLTIHRPDYSTTLRAHVFYSEQLDEGFVFGLEFYGGFHEKSTKLMPLFRDCSPIIQPGKPA